MANSSFNDSDNEPLSNLQKIGRSAQRNQQEEQPKQQSINRNVGKLPWGRPKGSASAKADLYSDKSVLSCVHLHQRSVHSNGVDKECAEKGIVYRRWVPNPELDSHTSIHPFLDSTVVLDEQKFLGHCMLCPKKKYFLDWHAANYHYTHVHIVHCLVIEDYKILMCKCSDIRSRDSDYCACNRQYHCYECYQPFDQPAQLARHLIIKHQVEEKYVIHIIPKNK